MHPLAKVSVLAVVVRLTLPISSPRLRSEKPPTEPLWSREAMLALTRGPAGWLVASPAALAASSVMTRSERFAKVSMPLCDTLAIYRTSADPDV